MKVIRGSKRREKAVAVPVAPKPAAPARSSGWAVSQDDARQRWREGYSVMFGGDFDLAVEVETLCRGLDTQIAGLQADVWASVVRTEDAGSGMVFGYPGYTPGWTTTRGRVRELCEAFHESWTALVKVLADGGALSAQTQAWVLTLKDATPVVSDDELSSGGWVPGLAARVAPLSVELQPLLSRTSRTTMAGLRSDASEDVQAALRALDRAADAVQKNVAAVRRAVPKAREKKVDDAVKERARQRADLAKLGL